MNIIKQLQKVMNQVEQIDYKTVHIEIETRNDRFIMDKVKDKNQIGFRSERG